MTKVRDATAYLRDRTIDGMNAGRDLWTLMREVTLPPELALPQVHGKVPWIVRAIWEEHVGWFRYESTTELYDTPPAVGVAGHRRISRRDNRAHRTRGCPPRAGTTRCRRCTSSISSLPTHPTTPPPCG